MRDDSGEKSCISFMAREVQPVVKPAKDRVEEKKKARPLDPARTAATEGWRTRPRPCTPRAEPAVSFGGPLAEETFQMANGEEPVEKVPMASSRVTVTSEDSVNSNLATLMVYSKVSGHYFDDAIIRDLKHRLQNCLNASHYAKFSLPGELC